MQTESTTRLLLTRPFFQISDKFHSKLETFKTTKLAVLTKMESDIFHDGTVYTGAAGLAMFYLMCPQKNDDHELLKVFISACATTASSLRYVEYAKYLEPREQNPNFPVKFQCYFRIV